MYIVTVQSQLCGALKFSSMISLCPAGEEKNNICKI